MKTISVINQKGGVGKTTISVNLAFHLAELGYKTLVVDLDPQSHTSSIFVKNLYEIKESLFTTINLFDGAPIKNFYKYENSKCLSIIPTTINLAKSAEQLNTKFKREEKLQKFLQKISNDYDFCIVDCPPSLSLLSVNAIYAADLILVPVIPAKGALDGVSDLFGTIKEVVEDRPLKIKIIRNNYDIRCSNTIEYIEEELFSLKDKRLNTIISKCEALNQADIAGQPLKLYNSKAKSVLEFENLSCEIINCFENV